MAQMAPSGNIWRESSGEVREVFEVFEVFEVRRNSASKVAILPMPCAAFLVETPAQFENNIRPRLKMRVALLLPAFLFFHALGSALTVESRITCLLCNFPERSLWLHHVLEAQRSLWLHHVLEALPYGEALLRGGRRRSRALAARASTRRSPAAHPKRAEAKRPRRRHRILRQSRRVVPK